jgi:protoporphyrin/coproporphyrin ferrochelatase
MSKAVLLLQMGGPETLKDVEPFLYNLFNDPFIIQLPSFIKPFQSTLARFISSRRTPKVSILYDEIGGGSPIRFETECQAKALEKSLRKSLDTDFKVYYAMRYSPPFLRDIIPVIKEDAIQDLIVIPLYPQYSEATTGSSLYECKDLFDKAELTNKLRITYIESWFDNPYYIELIQQRIIDQLSLLLSDLSIQKKESEEKALREDILILFSAHGLPEKYVERGDPYEQQIKSSVALIMQHEKLKIIRHKISYQSKVGPVKWLEPNTEHTIIELAERGEKNLIVVPISFVGDHIETLHEINIEYKELAEEHGVQNFLMTRAPKANSLLIKALESLIINVRTGVPLHPLN